MTMQDAIRGLAEREAARDRAVFNAGRGFGLDDRDIDFCYQLMRRRAYTAALSVKEQNRSSAINEKLYAIRSGAIN